MGRWDGMAPEEVAEEIINAERSRIGALPAKERERAWQIMAEREIRERIIGAESKLREAGAR